LRYELLVPATSTTNQQQAARRAYRAGERWVNAVLAGVFAYAGARMLLAR